MTKKPVAMRKKMMRNQGYGDTISLGTLPCACTLRPCLTYLQLFCSYQNKQAHLCHSLWGPNASQGA